VTAIHLARNPSAGEAIDGLVSGLWFAALFLAGGWLGARWFATHDRVRPGTAAREGLIGLTARALTWSLLWLAWGLPQAGSLRAGGFAINSATMIAAALALTAARDLGRRRT
jgi:hypothetical protein